MTPDIVDRLTTLMLIDILLEAQAGYWLKRAADFEKVGTPRCDEIAQACRNRAAFIAKYGDPEWAKLLPIELGDAA